MPLLSHSDLQRKLDPHMSLFPENVFTAVNVFVLATGYTRSHRVNPLLLQDFLKKEFSEENINFWNRCEHYKLIQDSEQVG